MSVGIALVVILGAGGTASAQGFNYVTCDGIEANCPIYPINPSAPMPQKGVRFADPDYNTTIVRVTDRDNDGGGLSCDLLLNPYATMKIENSDHSRILVSCGTGRYYLYDANTLEYIKLTGAVGSMGGGGGGNPEPYWDPSDPTVFYFRSDCGFYKYDIDDDSIVLIHDFKNEYPTCEKASNETKAEPSLDGRYWAFIIRAPWDGSVNILDWIIYDKQTDTVRSWNDSPAGQDTPAYNAKWIGMCPNGDHLVMKNTAGRHYIADADFQTPRVELADNSHGDFAYDVNGEEVYVFFGDFGPQQGGGRGLSMVYLNDPSHRVDIYPNPGLVGFHISGHIYDHPGWVNVSHYQADQQFWTSYALLIVELDPNKCLSCAEKPMVWRAGQTFATMADNGPGAPIGSYWAQAFATMSKDGTAIYWGTNWFDETSTQNIELYKAELNPGWWLDLQTGEPPTDPPPAPSGLRILP
jgi:hypothetical protein